MSDLVRNPEDRFSQNEAHILVKVADWPAFRKQLTTRLTLHSLCNLYTCICNFIFFSHFGFDARILVPIVLVPGHCIKLLLPRLLKLILALSGFRPGPTQTRLCSYRRWLEA